MPWECAFMVALPEEVLFRGLIQNLMQKAARTARGRLVAFVVASISYHSTAERLEISTE